MGYTGSERTTRQAVRVAKQAWKSGNRRVYRPWIPEPGMWFRCLGCRADGGRATDAAVLCLAGVVEVSGGDPNPGPLRRPSLWRRPLPRAWGTGDRFALGGWGVVVGVYPVVSRGGQQVTGDLPGAVAVDV
ncbi:MAG: hypothetical protein ACT4OM_09265 [Actinomycetota bacterium]